MLRRIKSVQVRFVLLHAQEPTEQSANVAYFWPDSDSLLLSRILRVRNLHLAPRQFGIDAAPDVTAAQEDSNSNGTLFATIYRDEREADRFYAFLQNIFNVLPEDRLHTLIKTSTAEHTGDERIYRAIQAGLQSITPRLASLS